MISVLIPVYNCDVRALVKALYEQISAQALAAEILVLDDHSTDEILQAQNAAISQYAGVDYQILPHNVGRARIRNILADRARFDYLLFMDCDVLPESADFLQNYIQHLQPNTVLCGGRSYQLQSPTQQNLLFHWSYGCQREQKTAAQRNAQPFYSFMTNNFVAPKSLFAQLRFDESLTDYGHEDTIFGLELERLGWQIQHIDNPLRHLGIEEAEVFIRKTEQAVKNLLVLEKKYGHLPQIRLLAAFYKLEKYKMVWLARLFYLLLGGLLRAYILRGRANLRWLDIYKLAYLAALR